MMIDRPACDVAGFFFFLAPVRRYPLLSLLLLFALGPTARGQDSPREFEVGTISFEGNHTVPDEILRTVIQTRETPGWFWKALYHLSEKMGEKAEYFDPATFETDYLLLTTYYYDQGFFHVKVDTSLVFDVPAKRMFATFMINEGPRSTIDSLEYRGLDGLPDEVKRAISEGSLVGVGHPFTIQTVNDEARRVFTVLLNHGFVNASISSPTATRYTSTNNMKVVFEYVPGIRYYFGDITIQQDSTVQERIEEAVILRHIDFVKGDFYSETKKFDSERNLNRLGVFERVQIEHLLHEVADTMNEVPMRISVRPRPFHELTPELGFNDEKNAFNIQLGVGYSNRNFLGGARNLSTRLRVNIQSIQDVAFSRVFGKNGLLDSTVISTVDLSTQMVQPFFITNRMSLTWKVSAILEKEKHYYLPILRNRVGVAAQTAEFTRAFLDWNLERISYSGVDPSLDSSIVNRLTLDRRPQFNSIITFTLQRDKRNDIFSPSSGFFHSGSIDESGLLPSISGGLFGSDLPYSRYIKLSLVGQWYSNPDRERKLIWATRLRGGFAELYGRSPAPVPLIHRFFAGGSGSVRGWKARDLGAVPNSVEGGTALFEASVEARWNLFRNFGKLWVLDLPKLSMVFFYDVGNVWTELKRVRASEIAMAAGFGLRYDTIAGPLRIDFGFRAYDPFAPKGSRWLLDKRFFPETFSGGVLHFGIGHAF
jgi:outer membrane protein insertion porin family